MKIPFRAWLLDQGIDSNSWSLFEEGLLCYQVGAYRAALVFSYLGFLRIIAQRLMTAEPPKLLPKSMWDTLQKRIRDDNVWEAACLDAAIQVKPVSMFLIDDDIRQQLQYWRSRRNDAAHSKNNELSYAHVETLWLFIRSNLGKFVVNGGRTGLLERFRRHFDPTYTPPGVDFSDLITQIPQAVTPLEYREFLSDALMISDIFYANDPPELQEDGKVFIEHIERLGDSQLMEALVEEVKSNTDLLIAVLHEKPNFVLHYSGDHLFIHKLWHDLLPMTQFQYLPMHHKSLSVVAVMLRNGLISEGFQAIALEHIVGKANEGSYHMSYPDELLEELEPFGFWDAFKKHAFEYGNIKWVANNLAFLFDYLDRYPVDTSVARIFCDLFPKEVPDDDDWSFQATELAEPEDYNDLGYYFYRNQQKFKDIIDIARRSGLTYEHFEKAMNPTNFEHFSDLT